MRPKEWSGKAEAGQTHFGPWENHGVIRLGAYFWAQEGELINWEGLAWIYQT